MVAPRTNQEVADVITGAAADLATAVHKVIQDHPLGQGDFGSLVRKLGVMYLAEIEAASADMGDEVVAREFRAMMLKPLRRAVGKLQGGSSN